MLRISWGVELRSAGDVAADACSIRQHEGSVAVTGDKVRPNPLCDDVRVDRYIEQRKFRS